MAEGGFDDYEMKEREQEQEQEQERVREQQELEEAQEQETNFDEDEAVTITLNERDHLDNEVRVDLDLQDNLDDNIPDVRKDIANIRRSLTNDVKKFFKDVFNVNIVKKNGPNSESILENTKFITEKSGSIVIEYKNKRIGRVGRDLEI